MLVVFLPLPTNLQSIFSLSLSCIFTRQNDLISFPDPSNRKYFQIGLLFFGPLGFGVFGRDDDSESL
jgi:hypothetical protein